MKRWFLPVFVFGVSDKYILLLDNLVQTITTARKQMQSISQTVEAWRLATGWVFTQDRAYRAINLTNCGAIYWERSALVLGRCKYLTVHIYQKWVDDKLQCLSVIKYCGKDYHRPLSAGSSTVSLQQRKNSSLRFWSQWLQYENYIKKQRGTIRKGNPAQSILL